MIRINLLGVEKRSTKTATFDFDVGQMVTVACSLVMVVTVVVLGWWYWSLRNESLQLDDELAAGRQEVTRLQAFGDEYSGARRPDWPGATTENIENIRGRSNAARRDAPPGRWQRTSESGH